MGSISIRWPSGFDMNTELPRCHFEGVDPSLRKTSRRFANRDAYASYNGTAPVERSSGGRVVHRLSLRGNRKLNHALHMVAVTQIRNPGTVGRIYFERKVADRKTKKEALRSLKRQISNAVYRQLLLDARRVREDTQGRLAACVTGSSPCATGSSAKSLPNP